MNCVFCEILKGTCSVEKIYYGETSLAIVPLNPCTLGHIIFISNKHVKDAFESPFTSAGVLYDIAEFMNDQIGDYNLITSVGTLATQSVFHLHIHLAPRRENDGIKLPWSK